MHLGTYNGNPVMLAAARPVLDVLTETDPYAALSSPAARLVDAFSASLRRHDVLGSVHAVGPVLQVALGVPAMRTVGDYGSAEWQRYDRLSVELLRCGQFVMPGGRWYLHRAHRRRPGAHRGGLRRRGRCATARMSRRPSGGWVGGNGCAIRVSEPDVTGADSAAPSDRR